jgi:purine-binding chemotaxis protein CheW
VSHQADVERILRERARELARAQRTAAGAAHGEALVVRVGRARYGIPLAGLAGVVGLDALTPLPGAPPFVAGLAHVYGHVTTIVDLGVVLGEAPEPPAAALLVEVRAGTFGLGVSAYESVVGVSDLGPAPPGLSETAARHVEGVLGTAGIALLRLSVVVENLLRLEALDEEP